MVYSRFPYAYTQKKISQDKRELKHFIHCCMKQFIDLNAKRGNYDLFVDLRKTDHVTQVCAGPQVVLLRVFKKYLKFKKFFSEKPTKSKSVGRRSIKLIIAQMNRMTAKENNYQYV